MRAAVYNQHWSTIPIHNQTVAGLIEALQQLDPDIPIDAALLYPGMTAGMRRCVWIEWPNDTSPEFAQRL